MKFITKKRGKCKIKLYDWDHWDVFYPLSYLLEATIRNFAKRGCGYPGTLKSRKEYETILLKIADMFKMIIDADVIGEEINQDQYSEGMDLFKEYFLTLWD